MKDKKVVICGYYGFANAGDEAMLLAVIQALQAIEPELDITVLSGNPSETATRHGVKAVNRLNLLAIAQVMAASDLVISGGGSLLQDVTSKRSIYYYLAIIKLAKLFRKPVMLYGQGIGPIQAKLARHFTAKLCRQVDLITVRDKMSVQLLKELGIEEKKVFLTADPVMGMQQVELARGQEILKSYGILQMENVFAISARSWRNLKNFKVVLAEVADRLVQKYRGQIVFMPLQYPDDLLVSQEIAKLMKEKEHATVIDQRCSIADFLSLVGNVRLLVGIRLHALIFGSVMKVPVLGISYDPKIEGFLEGINGKCVGSLEDVTTEKVMQEIAWMLEKQKSSQNFNEHDLRLAALKNAELALELLKNSN